MMYEITPMDNFFFRPPAPFEAEGETIAFESGFPPLPSVYAGAFRKFLASRDRGASGIRIGYSGIKLNGCRYLPMPLDLYALNGEKDGATNVRFKQMERPYQSNFPLPCILSTPQDEGKEKNHKNLYMPDQVFASYLQAVGGHLTCIDLNQYLTKEKKLGIRIDDGSGTSKDGFLYQISCVKPDKDMKLEVDLKGELIKDSGIIKIGGEGRTAAFWRTEDGLSFQWEPEDRRFFKLYLATPAIFKNGWLPGWINSASKTGYFSHKKRKVQVKLVGACVGRPVLCGGFGYDKIYKQYKPRELRYGVPAGSVYYFELLQGDFKDAVRLFHEKCISEYRETMGFDYEIFSKSRYCDRGFGYAFVGKLNEEQEEQLNVQ